MSVDFGWEMRSSLVSAARVGSRELVCAQRIAAEERKSLSRK